MENRVSWLAQLVNHVFGHFALAVLSALHLKPNNPSAPIPEHVVMALCVLLLGTVLALLVRSRLSLARPGGVPQARAPPRSQPDGGVHEPYPGLPHSPRAVPRQTPIHPQSTHQ